MTTIAIEDSGQEIRTLLERVEREQEIVLTRSGRTIARVILETIEPRRGNGISTAERMQNLRKGLRLDGLSLRSLREEGRP
jgi:antitoxin (DNA-binding transcriptional repressor) of toxin-antitoxin stability system